MIYVFGKAHFFALSTLEQALCRFGSLALQLGAKPSMSMAKAVYLRAAVLIPVAVTGNILNAQVNAKKIVNVFGIGFVSFARGKQVKLTVDQAQVRLATTSLQKLFSPIMSKEWDRLATVDSPDGNLILGKLPSQDTTIKSDRAERLKFSLGLFVNLIGVSHLRDTANCQLGSQVEVCANVMVDKLLHLKLTKYSRIPSHVADKVARSIGRFKCAPQAFGLRFGGYKFYLSC